MKKIQDWSFAKRLFAVALPMIIQNGITNFVSMLDNIMVGQVGTLPMSGVSIVNQVLFVFNLCIFGAMSGAGIFTAQFHGADDKEGERYTFRFKILVGVILTAIGLSVFLFGGKFLISLYLTGDTSGVAAAETMSYGWDYLMAMLWGLPAFALANAYASTMRETGETTVPMVAGVVAVFVNLIGNYILIFGHFGAPKLGVVGAAVATVISRYVELAIVVFWAHRNPEKNAFIQDAYRGFSIPGALTKKIILKGMPLLVNEFFWSTGMAFMNQCYSTRGLDVVAAMNIATTITMLCSVVFMALGNSVGIIMGQMLGAGVPEEQIRRDNFRMVALSVGSCLGLSLVLIALAFVFPNVYNTTQEVRAIATGVIIIGAVMMPVNSYNNAMYFTLRSGGQTFITFIFDSGFSWCVCVPIAFILSRFTTMGILPLYAIVHGTDILKVGVGAYLLKKGVWIRRIVT